MINCFGKLILSPERALYTLGKKHIIDWSPERAKHIFDSRDRYKDLFNRLLYLFLDLND